MIRKEALPHLGKLKQNLINSNYPSYIIDKHISKTIYEIDKNIKPTTKTPHDFIYKIPYISESFTNKLKRITKQSGLHIRVVVQSGMPLKSLLRSPINNKCECIPCLSGIPCSTKNFVYRAECTTCGEEYIGGSTRTADKRIGEHEASIRCKNDRTILGKHWQEHHPQPSPDSPNNQNRSQNRPKRRLTKKEKSEQLKRSYKFGIVHKGKDSLETFLLEAIAIKDRKPKLNNMISNGFIL